MIEMPRISDAHSGHDRALSVIASLSVIVEGKLLPSQFVTVAKVVVTNGGLRE